MGTGYVRNDTSNNIDNNNVANASDLDGEFDAIVDAFASATGHTHDGTDAEGGAITVVGPAQDYVGGAGDFSPKTDSVYDLGKTAVRWATGYIDDLDVTTNITVGGTVDGRDVASDGSKLDGIEAGADATDTASVTAAGALMDSEVDADIKTLSLPANTTISTYGASLVDDTTAAAARTTLGLGSIATQAASSVTITGGSISGITDLAVADGGTGASTAAGARTNLGLVIGTDVQAYDATILVDADIGSTVQGYDANLPTWPATVDATEVGYLNGVTSAIQTQINTLDTDKADLASPALTGTPTAPTAAASTDTTQIATTAFVQDAVGSAGAIVLLDSQTASAVPNLVFTAFDNATYGSYIFQFENLRPQTDDILEVRFSDDGGLNYAVGLGSYEYSHISFATGGSVTGTADNTESSIILTTTVNGGIVGEGVNGEMRLFDPLAAGKTNVVTRFGYVNGATDACTASGFGNRTSVEVTDAVRFFFQTGVNIAGGTIRMYGVKK